MKYTERIKMLKDGARVLEYSWMLHHLEKLEEDFENELVKTHNALVQ